MPEAPVLTETIPFSLPMLGLLAWSIVFVMYATFSAILVYHWRSYATNAAVARTTLIWYFAGSGTCMLVAGILIFFL